MITPLCSGQIPGPRDGPNPIFTLMDVELRVLKWVWVRLQADPTRLSLHPREPEPTDISVGPLTPSQKIKIKN